MIWFIPTTSPLPAVCLGDAIYLLDMWVETSAAPYVIMRSRVREMLSGMDPYAPLYSELQVAEKRLYMAGCKALGLQVPIEF